MKQSMQYKPLILALAMAVGCGSSSIVAAEGVTLDAGASFINDRVMYSIGGGSVLGAPTTRITPVEIGIGWNAKAGCGGFDLSTTVTNQLNGIEEGFRNIMDNAAGIATGLAANLAALVLQRANPGLYEFITNGVMQAKMAFDQSKLSCEAVSSKMADVIGNNGWKEMSKGTFFQDLFSAQPQGVDAVGAIKDSEANIGMQGIKWLKGLNKGGAGQESIKITNDVVLAGYNSLLQRDALLETAVSESECKGGAVCTAWKSPDEATEFAKEVLGEVEIKTCNQSEDPGAMEEPVENETDAERKAREKRNEKKKDEANCDPRTKPGRGLTGYIEKTFKEKHTALNDLVNNNLSNAQMAEALKKASTSMLPVTLSAVEAIRANPDKAGLVHMVASEVALADAMNKAFQLQRILLAGIRHPDIGQNEKVLAENKRNLEALNAEIDSLLKEQQARLNFAQKGTLNYALDAYQDALSAAEQTQESAPRNRSGITEIIRAPVPRR